MGEETPKAAAAFHDYCLMGSGRSLRKLADQRDASGTKAVQLFKQFGKWSSRHNWQERVKQYDEEQARQLDATIAAEKAKVLTSQYALMHKRVEALNKLAQKLEAMLDEEKNIWLPDVKQIGSGPYAERVDLVTFNDALVSEYRATFADLAAEMGERVKKQELTGKNGSPLATTMQVHVFLPSDDQQG